MIRLALYFGLLAAAIAWSSHNAHAHGAGHHGHAPAPAPAAGPSTAYAFPIAKPGTYALPAIKRAAGGAVLDETGRARDLADLVRGRPTVLAFVYTKCGDVCPLATQRLADLRELAAAEPRLARALRLVSMSFDPDHDTPSVMAEHAELWRAPDPKAPEWLFVTAPERAALAPVLEAYGQTLAPRVDPLDAFSPIDHILRVFLIDGDGTVRNIYSLEFLDPDLVLADVRTLLLEQRARARSDVR